MIQDDEFTDSRIRTVVIAVITSNVGIAQADGNVMITTRQSGLSKDSVVNVSQIVTIDKSLFLERVQSLPKAKMKQVNEGLKLVLSLFK